MRKGCWRFLQEARVLPELRRAPHGRECAASDGGGVRPRPVRQWVLSFPVPLRFLFASKPETIGPVLGIAHRVIAGWLADQAGVDRATAQCGAVTLIQRFGSALNLTNSPGANLNSQTRRRFVRFVMPF